MAIRTSFAAAAALTAAGALSAPAGAQDFTFTVAHGSPEGHVIAAQGVDPWLACMRENAGDRVGFRVFPGGQIAGLRELLPALQSGIADMAPVPVGYMSEKLPLNGVSMLPGLGSTADEVISAYSQALDSGPLAEEFAANDVVPIWVMAFPPYQIVGVADEMTSLDDMQGKVIRSAGGSMNLVIQSLGGSPAEIPVSDMYIALERGTVDGTISALNSLKPYNVQELMKSTSTNASFGTFTNVFSIARYKWEELPEDVQAQMMECGKQVEQSIATFMDEESAALAEEFASMGVNVFQFSPEQLQTIDGKLAVVHEDWVNRLAERGLPAQQVLDDFRTLAKGS